MFLQYRPFWQPNSLPGFLYPDVQRLTQELDAARENIAYYQNKIQSLRAELKAYRRIIRYVHTRENIQPSVAKISNLAMACRRNDTPQAPTNPDSLLAVITTPSTQPSTASVKSTTSDNPTSQSDWSVIYNPEVKQSIDIHVAHTFDYKHPVCCLKFSLDGRYIAIGLQWSGETHIYDLTTRKEKCILANYPEIEKRQVSIFAVSFSPDSKYVATGGTGNQISIWEIERRKLRAIFKDHRGDIFSVAFSPDGRFLVSCSYDESVRIWRLRDGSSLELCDNALGYYDVCFSPDGQYIAAANSDKNLRIWCSRTGKLVQKWMAHEQSPMAVAYTSDGKGLVSGGNDQTIKCWDVSSIGRSASSEANQRPKEIFKFEGHTEPVRSLAYLPNNRLLLSGSTDQSVRIWNTDTADWECTLQGHKHRVTTVDSCKVEGYLVSGSLIGEVVLWRYE